MVLKYRVIFAEMGIYIARRGATRRDAARRGAERWRICLVNPRVILPDTFARR
jgi:hypothetical protein